MNTKKKLMLWSFFGPIGVSLVSFIIIQIIAVIQGGGCISTTMSALFPGIQPFGTPPTASPSTFCEITNALAMQIMPKVVMIASILIVPGIISGIIFFFIGRSKKPA